MITATADELNWSRSWIGNTESDETFNERFDRYFRTDQTVYTKQTSKRAEALYSAIEESLRSQLAAYTTDQPSTMSADGNSVSYSHNMTTLQKTLDDFMVRYGSNRVRVSHFKRRIKR